MTRRLNTFGKRGGGGRRDAERTPMSTMTQLVSLAHRQPAQVLNISQQGAKVVVARAPEVGSEVFLVMPTGDMFAKVVWSTETECGLKFDQEIASFEFHRLSH